MGMIFKTKSGMDIETICPACQTEGILGRMIFSNGTQQAAYWCAKCEYFLSAYISHAQIKAANIVIERLPLFRDNTQERPKDPTEILWSDRPDCLCGAPMRLAKDRQEGIWRARWVCRECGTTGPYADDKTVEQSLFRLDRLPEVRVIWARAVDYHTEYLQSSWWKRVRWAKLWSAGEMCALCRATEDLNVHHNTYCRLGCERPEDLIVLCRRCHETFHDLIPKPDLEEDNDAF